MERLTKTRKTERFVIKARYIEDLRRLLDNNIGSFLTALE